MTAIEQIFTQPWAQRLGWSLLHFLWQGLVIAALLTVAMTTLRRRSADLRYAVACMALAAMVAAPVVTFCVMPAGAIEDVPVGQAEQGALDVTMAGGKYARLIDVALGIPTVWNTAQRVPAKNSRTACDEN